MEKNGYFRKVYDLFNKFNYLLTNPSLIQKKLILLVLPFFIANMAFAAGTAITVNGASPSEGCTSSATSITVTYSKSGPFTGNTFTAQLSNSSGSFASPLNIGSVTSNTAVPINATIPSGLPVSAGYRIRVISSSPSNISTNSILFSINAEATPSSSITLSSGTNPSCSGSPVTFTATAVNGGASPSYQWRINGSNSGTNNSSFLTSALNDSDIVDCIVTSNAACISSSSAPSNSIMINIDPLPAVTANASSATICSGGSIILSGGGASSYSWSHGVTNGVAFSPAATETYTVTGTSNGCSNTSQVTVVVDPCTGGARLNNSSCGASGLSLASYIFCERVSGASDYEFIISNVTLGYSQVRTSGANPFIKLNLFPGLMYGESYNVNVKAQVGGVWGSMGPTCLISLMPMPSVSLNNSSCGTSGLSLSSYIFSTSVVGANEYEFTISNAGTGYTQIRSNGSLPFIKLNSYTGLMYGQTYDVTVRARVGSVWGPGGSSCPITLMGFPSTCLNNSSCGATGLSTLSYIYAEPISGATEYEFTISNINLGYSLIKNKGCQFIKLNEFPGLLEGETYDVTVRALVETTWGPQGQTCQIALGAAALAENQETNRSMMATNNSIQPIQKINIYPNPLTQLSILKVEIPDQNIELLRIIDAIGKIVYEGKYTQEQIAEINIAELKLQPGMYNIFAISKENIIQNKFLITK